MIQQKLRPGSLRPSIQIMKLIKLTLCIVAGNFLEQSLFIHGVLSNKIICIIDYNILLISFIKDASQYAHIVEHILKNAQPLNLFNIGL